MSYVPAASVQQNKANSKRSQVDCGFRIVDWDRPAAGRQGPIAQNKPNVSRGADREIGVPGGPACETKPIPVGAELQLMHLQEWSYVVCAWRIGREKQSQLAPGAQEWARAEMARGQMCETKPIPLPPSASRVRPGAGRRVRPATLGTPGGRATAALRPTPERAH